MSANAHEGPAYRKQLSLRELEHRAKKARALSAECVLCPRRCGAARLEGGFGFCQTGERARVASWGPHHGEEAPISGTRGSGTIFFSWCHLACVFCQNAELAHEGAGRDLEAGALAAIMLELEARGAHNVNLVSPSHVVAPFLDALVIAARKDLSLPIVYNSSGYDAPEALALLDGVVDIYMPDLKYADDERAARYSGAPDYARVSRVAIREMHRQVGDLALDEAGVARRGLLVRHLVLPNDVAGSEACLRFLAEEISRDTWVNVMGQYRPAHEAREHPELARRTSAEELRAARDAALRLGLRRLD